MSIDPITEILESDVSRVEKVTALIEMKKGAPEGVAKRLTEVLANLQDPGWNE